MAKHRGAGSPAWGATELHFPLRPATERTPERSRGRIFAETGANYQSVAQYASISMQRPLSFSTFSAQVLASLPGWLGARPLEELGTVVASWATGPNKDKWRGSQPCLPSTLHDIMSKAEETKKLEALLQQRIT